MFDRLNKISVAGKTEQKGKFTYLSWTYSWSELKKIAPDAKTTVYHDENTNLPYFSSTAGVIVKVGVTVNELEHISYLPCMDFSNKAKKVDKVDMMDVNKAIQRATVKAIALHGLGLYIYAGEDLPEGEEKPKTKSPVKKKDDAEKSSTSFRQSVKKDEPVKAASNEEEEL
tara:strand:- start:237 stop:749 length:513 start_codon:yes stop_codon:yes gene_type:complete